MDLEQVLLYLGIPLIAVVLLLLVIAIRLAKRDYLRMRLKGLGVELNVVASPYEETAPNRRWTDAPKESSDEISNA